MCEKDSLNQITQFLFDLNVLVISDLLKLKCVFDVIVVCARMLCYINIHSNLCTCTFIHCDEWIKFNSCTVLSDFLKLFFCLNVRGSIWTHLFVHKLCRYFDRLHCFAFFISVHVKADNVVCTLLIAEGRTMTSSC